MSKKKQDAMHNYQRRFRMKLYALASVVGAFGCGPAQTSISLETGTEQSAVAQAIVNGAATGPEVFDAVGALVSTDKYGQTIDICTATLIAPDVVLTAAHCITPKAYLPAGWQLWFTTAPDARLFSQTQPIRVAHTLWHPDFDPEGKQALPFIWPTATAAARSEAMIELETACGAYPVHADPAYWQCIAALPADLHYRLGLLDEAVNRHDVGLAILADPVQNAALALLPTAVTASVWPKQPMQAVGYGVFDRPYDAADRGLRHVGTVHLDAIGLFELQVDFAQSQLSFGDSGGPLFVAGDVAQEIVGIASRSFVTYEGICQGPTMYARTSAFTPWIRQSLRQACKQAHRSVEMCRAHPF